MAVKYMKIFSVMAVIVYVCFFVGVKEGRAATGTGNFTISATVTAGPCTVDSSSSTQDFGDVFAGDITGKGTFKNFSLTLSNCPPATSTVTATFSGTADATAPAWYYKNSGSATGIGIELASDGGGAGLGNGNTMTATVDSSRKATFNLSTRINKEGTPMPGTILATVTVTYSYA